MLALPWAGKTKVGTGFLFYDGGTDGGRRGAPTGSIGAKRSSWSGCAMLTLGDTLVRSTSMPTRRIPDTNTKVAGVNLERRSSPWSSEPATTSRRLRSSHTRRHVDLRPAEVDAEAWNVSATGELAYEANGGLLEAFGAMASSATTSTCWVPISA